MDSQPEQPVITFPDNLCKWFHKWPCLAHIGVLRGLYAPCEICAPHLERTRKMLKIEKISDPEPCPHEEHDHGICLECGADVHDALVEQAESLRS